MIYLNFSAKTLKTILTRLQIVCICFTKVMRTNLTPYGISFEQNQEFSPKGISYEQPLTLKEVARLSIFGTLIFFGGGKEHVILIPEIFFFGEGRGRLF